MTYRRSETYNQNISKTYSLFHPFIQRKSLHELADCSGYHTVPYRTTPHHTIPNHPYHTIPYHTIPSQAMPCHAMPCHAMPCHAMPCHTIQYKHGVLYDLIIYTFSKTKSCRDYGLALMRIFQRLFVNIDHCEINIHHKKDQSNLLLYET